MAQLHGLTICEPPLSLPADPVTMLYRRVDQADGRARWFRRLFLDVAVYSMTDLNQVQKAEIDFCGEALQMRK